MTIAPERATEQPADVLERLPIRPPWPWRRKLLVVIAAVFAVTTYRAFGTVGMSVGALIDGLGDMRRLIDRMLPIRFDNLGHTIELAVETFFIAFAGTALAVAISTPVAFLAARNTTVNGVVFGAARGFIVAMRAVPDLVFALIFVRAIGIGGTGGIIAGVLAIGLHAVGMVGKLYADAIEQIDEGPREAVLATGGTKRQAIVTGVVPQVMPSFIGVALYRLDINFRTSTVLGYVGAGGIGELLRLYLSGLRYDRALGVTVVIVVLVLAVEFLSAAVRRSVLGTDPFASRRLSSRAAAAGRRLARKPTAPSVPGVPAPTAAWTADAPSTAAGARPLPFDPNTVTPPWTRQRIRTNVYLWLGVVTLIASFVVTGITPIDFVRSTWDIAVVSTRLVPSDLSWWNPTLRGALIETVAIGLVSTFIGLLMSLPLAFLAASNVAPGRLVYAAVRALVVVIRAIPELILAVLFVAALGLGPFPGAVALSIGTVGFATKLFADAIEEVRQGPRDAVTSTGASRIQEAGTGVVPQVMPAIVGTSLYILDINIRASTILGIVGAGGVGFYLIQATRVLDWNTVGGILIMLFVIVYAIERLSGWIRKQLI